jgi:hypothetical protein
MIVLYLMKIVYLLLSLIYGLNLQRCKKIISKYKTYNIILDSKNITSSIKINCKNQLDYINKTIISKIDKDRLLTYYVYNLFFILID